MIKMKARILFLCLLLLPILSSKSFALVNDGNLLLSECIESEDFFRGNSPNGIASRAAVSCASFVEGFRMGVFASHSLYERAGVSKNEGICIPSTVTTIQLVPVLVNWLKENPRELHQPSYILIMLAMREAYRCP